MDWADTAEQASFRSEVRSLIESRLPERYRKQAEAGAGGFGSYQDDRISENADHKQAAVDWAKALSEKGWVAPHWPQEYGGAGLSPMEQFIFNQEMASAGAPGVGGSGVSMLGPVLIIHGTDEQKAQHLPKILSGEAAWCQGYSEPGSGSDLASLQTRAVHDGDDYVINGQK
ncbi:MAG: acyl-CoA dehydrogenase family protein, partial [Dehalococcoidia bacterium]